MNLSAQEGLQYEMSYVTANLNRFAMKLENSIFLE